MSSSVSRLSCIASLVVACLPSALCAVEMPERVPLTLRDAIEMALRNNLEIQWNRQNIQLDQARLGMSWGDFDPDVNYSINVEHYEIPQNAQEFIASRGVAGAQRIYEEDNLRMSYGIGTKTPWGGRFAFNNRADRLDDDTNRNPFAAVYNPEYYASTGLEFRQPLLRDFGFDANMVDVRIQRKDLEISQLQWEQKIQESVAAVATNFFEMQFGMENIRVRQSAVDADQKLLDQNRRRMELGFLSPLDVAQAEVAVSEDEEALIVAKNQFIEAQYKLQRQILGEHAAYPYRIFEPVGTFGQIRPPELNRERLLATAFENRPDYHSSRKEVEKNTARVKYARNQVLPRVDLVGNYGYAGLKGSYADSIHSAWSGHSPQVSVGVQFSMPLGSVKERNQLIAAKSLEAQSNLKYKESELQIGIDVDTALSRLELARQKVETAANSRKVAEDAVRLANRRLEEGQLSSFDVLEQRKKLYSAQTREIASIGEYNSAVVDLRLSTGTILRDHGIIVEDPIKNRGKKPEIHLAPGADGRAQER